MMSLFSKYKLDRDINSELSQFGCYGLLSDNFHKDLKQRIMLFGSVSEMNRVKSILNKMPSESAYKNAVDQFQSARVGIDRNNKRLPIWLIDIIPPDREIRSVLSLTSWLNGWQCLISFNEFMCMWNKYSALNAAVIVFENNGFEPRIPNLVSRLKDIRSCLDNWNSQYLRKSTDKRNPLWIYLESELSTIDRNLEEFKSGLISWKSLKADAINLLNKRSDGQSKRSSSAHNYLILEEFINFPSEFTRDISEIRSCIDSIISETANINIDNKDNQESSYYAKWLSDPFVGGRPVWGSICDQMLPSDMMSKLEQLLICSDDLLNKQYKQYKRIKAGARGREGYEEEDEILFGMLQNQDTSLTELKDWTSLNENDPAGQLLDEFLDGKENVIELLQLYNNDKGFKKLINPALECFSWLKGDNARFPKSALSFFWAKEILYNNLRKDATIIDLKIDGVWDEDLFLFLQEVDWPSSVIIRYLGKIWESQNQEIRNAAWQSTPDRLQNTFIEIWISNLLCNVIVRDQIESDLQIFGYKTKQTILHMVIEHAGDKCSKELEQLLEVFPQTDLKVLVQDYFSKNESSQILKKKRLFAELAYYAYPKGSSFSISDPAIYDVIIEGWLEKIPHIMERPELVSACLIHACKLEIARPYLILIFDPVLDIEPNFKLSPKQWALMNPELLDSAMIAGKRLARFMLNSSDRTCIPDAIWQRFVTSLQRAGEKIVKSLEEDIVDLLKEAQVSTDATISRLAGLLYWANRVIGKGESASLVPDSVLEIKVEPDSI